jgi:hypothetical protein
VGSLPDGFMGLVDVTGGGLLPVAVAEFAEFTEFVEFAEFAEYAEYAEYAELAEAAEAVACGLEGAVEIGSWPTTAAHMSRKAYTASLAIA